MPREQSHTAIILKKQPFGEADEIITFYTRESGKVRGLAKSVKLAKARLQNNLQNLTLAEVSLAGHGQLPKIIAAEAKKTFSGLRHNLELLKRAFYASELILRFTPDGQKDEQLFGLYLEFLEYLDSDPSGSDLALAKFKTGFLQAAGLSATAHDSLGGQDKNLRLCRDLESCAFKDLDSKAWEDVGSLQKFLSNFIVFHLERQVKSEGFLNAV